MGCRFRAIPALAKRPKLGEGIGFRVGYDFLVFDLKALGEPLIEHPAFLGLSQEIGGLRLLVHQAKRQIKLLESFVVIDAQRLDTPFGGDALFPDPLLLLGKQVFADLVVVVGRQELAFLSVKLRELDFGLGHLLGGQQRHGIGLRLDGSHDVFALLVAELLVGIGSLDGGLDSLDPMGALGAVAMLLAAADEILVFAAVAVGAGVGQATAALAAVQAASEVMEVPPGLFAPDPLDAQQFLDILERLLVNQGLMPALVGLAVVGDEADVIGVAEQAVNVLRFENTGRVLPRRAGPEAPLLKDCRQLGE